jgi:hypothetical protein
LTRLRVYVVFPSNGHLIASAARACCCRNHAFRRAANAAGVTEAERVAIIEIVAANPTTGDLIEGTGGARKFRFAGNGKGKSGGYKAERNELKEILATLGEEWRQSAKTRLSSPVKKSNR